MRRIQLRAAGMLSSALLGLSLGFSLPAQAVGIGQSDAGSGGDAGDIMRDAVPVTTGYHSAQLSPAADPVDWYKMQLTKGDKLRIQLSDYNALGLKSVVMKVLSPAGQAIELEPEGLMLAGSAYLGKAAELIVHETGTWYFRAEPFRDGAASGAYGFRVAVTPGFGTVINTRNQSWIVLEMHADQPTEVFLQGRMQGTMYWDQPYWGTMSTERELDGQAPSGFGYVVRGSGRGTSTTLSPLGIEEVDVIGPALGTFELTGTTHMGWTQLGTAQGYVRYIVALGQDDPWLSLGVWTDQPVTMMHTMGNDNVAWSETNSGADLALVTPGVSVIGERELEIDLGSGFRGSFVPGNAQSGAAYRPDGSQAPLHASCDCITFRPSKYMGYTEDALPGDWRFELGQSLSGPNRSTYLTGVRVQYPGLF